jgi:hypothetical protein
MSKYPGELERNPSQHGSNEVKGQELAGPVKILHIRPEPPQRQHIQSNMPEAGRVVQEGARQQPPNLAMRNCPGIHLK